MLSVFEGLKLDACQWPKFPRSSGKQVIVYAFSALFQLLLLYLDYDYGFVSFNVWIHPPCIMMTMPLLFCHCFARYLLHGYCWTLIFFSLICRSYLPLQTKVTPPPPPKHCLKAAKDAPAAFNSLVVPPCLSLSMHGIQIISRASLCCCMEGMGVFELDLLDNIRSTQISFHARLFHADRVAHTGMLIWLLLFFRKFEMETSISPTSMSCS